MSAPRAPGRGVRLPWRPACRRSRCSPRASPARAGHRGRPGAGAGRRGRRGLVQLPRERAAGGDLRAGDQPRRDPGAARARPRPARARRAGPAAGPGRRGSRVPRDRADQPAEPTRASRWRIQRRSGPRWLARWPDGASRSLTPGRGAGPERRRGHPRHRAPAAPAHGERSAAGRWQPDSSAVPRMPVPAASACPGCAGHTGLRFARFLPFDDRAAARHRAARRRGRRRGAVHHRRESRRRGPGPARRRPAPAARRERRAGGRRSRWHATGSGWPAR